MSLFTPARLRVGTSTRRAANGLEMDLDWVRLNSNTVQARLCFTPPDGKDWRLVSPTLQLGADPNQLASVTPVPASPAMPVTDENGIRCQVATFPVSTQGAQIFFLKAAELATPAGETLQGDWTFNWNQLPGQMQFPGIAPLEPAPLGSDDDRQRYDGHARESLRGCIPHGLRCFHQKPAGRPGGLQRHIEGCQRRRTE